MVIRADWLSAYLARGVDYLGSEVLTAVFDHLTERVFDSGIVAVYKVLIHELHRE